jgi:hypothetical protein
VVPAMLVLASEGAPTRTTLCAGAGGVEAAHITLTQGAYIGTGADADDRLVALLDQVRDRAGEQVPGQRRERRAPTRCGWRARTAETQSGPGSAFNPIHAAAMTALIGTLSAPGT